jgi:hypothetical protein
MFKTFNTYYFIHFNKSFKFVLSIFFSYSLNNYCSLFVNQKTPTNIKNGYKTCETSYR